MAGLGAAAVASADAVWGNGVNRRRGHVTDSGFGFFEVVALLVTGLHPGTGHLPVARMGPSPGPGSAAPAMTPRPSRT